MRVDRGESRANQPCPMLFKTVHDATARLLVSVLPAPQVFTKGPGMEQGRSEASPGRAGL